MSSIHDLLSQPIEVLDLSIRSRNTVRGCLGVVTVADLCLITPDELLNCKCMGVTGVREIEERLASVGLCLRGERLPASGRVKDGSEVGMIGLPPICIGKLERRLGIRTFGQLVATPPARLEAYLGARGMAELMHALWWFRLELPSRVADWCSGYAADQFGLFLKDPMSHRRQWIGVLDTCWKTTTWLWSRGVMTVDDLLAHSDVSLWLMVGSSRGHLDEVKVRLDVFGFALADYIPDANVARLVEQEPGEYLDAPVSILGVRRRTLQILERREVGIVREAVELLESPDCECVFERFPIGWVDLRQQLMALGFIRRHLARGARLGSQGKRILVGAS